MASSGDVYPISMLQIKLPHPSTVPQKHRILAKENQCMSDWPLKGVLKKQCIFLAKKSAFSTYLKHHLNQLQLITGGDYYCQDIIDKNSLICCSTSLNFSTTLSPGSEVVAFDMA